MDHLTWGPHASVFECWTTLTALLYETSRIHLGPFFLCNGYRNPALVAKMAATLDNISQGRLELGMGAGWKDDEYLAYGYPFGPPRERIEQLDEAVTLMKMMWSGNAVSFQGKYYQITEAVCRPQPVQHGGPRLWIGGGGEQLTLKVTAKHAQACNFSGRSTSLTTFQHKVAVLNRHCASMGRDPNEIIKSVTLEIVLGKTRDDATRREKTAPPSLTPETRFVGTPDQCVAHFQQFIDAGATYFMLHIEDMLTSLELFEHEVLPAFT
jgi:alkanesulfonate monooxygenase SsuD/methylene tetrahydromethanopterin reductase-like flavin-dependent oxidoreductase (luciferase family)